MITLGNSRERPLARLLESQSCWKRHDHQVSGRSLNIRMKKIPRKIQAFMIYLHVWSLCMWRTDLSHLYQVFIKVERNRLFSLVINAHSMRICLCALVSLLEVFFKNQYLPMNDASTSSILFNVLAKFLQKEICHVLPCLTYSLST